MAELIPALGNCAARMTSGEKRLAERLQQKLGADYLLWWDVPVGPLQTRPDFIVIHPSHGALILETKDWHLETIHSATPQRFEIAPGGRLTVTYNPLTQARHGAIRVVNALEADSQLVQVDGPYQGKLSFPWGHGVVLTRITRQQFTDAGLAAAIPAHLVICKDEMLADVRPEVFEQRLLAMLPYTFRRVITGSQLDRIRWILFPEIRVPRQQSLFGDGQADEDGDELPGIMQVMDLQQEQLARSLGDGHRVIHGVAGSGKTMILGYRAEHLARAAQAPGSKPILVLCYNEPLGVKLAADMAAKGLSERVHVMHWDKWTRSQLAAHGLLTPDLERMGVSQKMAAFVQRVTEGLESQAIPSGQYQAVLIDEGHDFAPDWLRLVTQMVDPETNSLLLLYDDAQSLYDRGQKRNFSLKSVGIQAQGRTTILKINYRNTRQILQLAHRLAGDLLTPADAQDEDGIPLLKPLSCGREGPDPILVDLPTLPERAARMAELLADQHAQGHAWGEMAVLCRHHDEMEICAHALQRKGLPFRMRKKSGHFRPEEDAIKLMTMHVSKGLEWPVVAVISSEEERRSKDGQKDAELEARLFYVAATRAVNRLISIG
ncbi:DEAD/DEAH box helicase [Comamonas composti]|uniref:DEAD/DEAH box helicase n=1 Tax=Comamonas composti TaxID=408558 RepID=UPI000409E9C3|nr:3'-5' exonuclease [Comamonas composti]